MLSILPSIETSAAVLKFPINAWSWMARTVWWSFGSTVVPRASYCAFMGAAIL